MIVHSPTLLYQTSTIRQLERIAVSDYAVSVDTLMQRAGQATFHLLREIWPQARNIVVVCGKGNNAGDGYVVAKCAHEAGLNVQVLQLVELAELQGAAYRAAVACYDCGISMRLFSNSVFNDIKIDVIVDALLGTGLRGTVAPNYSQAIAAINAMHLPVIAVDIPSGVHADTGHVETSAGAVKASYTMTFIAVKTGMVTSKAAEFCGRIICDDLDLTKEIFLRVRAQAMLLDLSNCLAHLPGRLRYAYKGDFGHVLVVGGDYGMGGAVRMAAEAAIRCGAGLVSVATRHEHVPAINAARPEIMCYGIKTSQDLFPLLKKATCVIVGPGLGRSLWSRSLWQEIIFYDNLPLVIDADGLNLLAEFVATADIAKQLSCLKQHWILTPHPGEAARLLNVSTAAIGCDRYMAVVQLQQKYGGVVVLKGSGTLLKGISSDLVAVCPYGNPGMASGGMGDVLSGVIGGLIAQGMSIDNAAQLGVCVHAKAADLLALECGGERGLLAMDLLPYIKELLNKVEK